MYQNIHPGNVSLGKSDNRINYSGVYGEMVKPHYVSMLCVCCRLMQVWVCWSQRAPFLKVGFTKCMWLCTERTAWGKLLLCSIKLVPNLILYVFLYFSLCVLCFFPPMSAPLCSAGSHPALCLRRRLSTAWSCFNRHMNWLIIYYLSCTHMYPPLVIHSAKHIKNKSHKNAVIQPSE